MTVIRKRYLLLVNSFIIFLFMGISYAWSIFATSLEGYYNWTRAQTSLAFTLNTVFFSIGAIIAGLLSKKISYKNLLRISAGLIFFGFILTTNIQYAWQLYITYSLLCGVGIGMGYNAVVSTLPRWFPEKSGFMTGVLLLGYALSTAVLGPVSTVLINTFSWQTAFIVIGVCVFVVLVVGSFNLRVPNDLEQILLPKNKISVSVENIDTIHMVKTPVFWMYFLSRIILTGVGLSVFNHITKIMAEFFAQGAVLSVGLLSVLSLANGLGRIFWGFIYDKLGMKLLVRFISITFAVSMSLIVVGIVTENIFLFMISGVTLVFAFGGNAGTLPTVTRGLFGNMYFSVNYSIVNCATIVASVITTLVGVFQTEYLSYGVSVIFLLVLSLLGAVFGFFVKNPRE